MGGCAWLLLTSPLAAQYDRDGRYVPSPNGVPTDPDARLIPMYPGTPGGAIGTPSLPRPPALAPRLQPPAPSPSQLLEQRLPRDTGFCTAGWSRATRLTATEFRRVCRRPLR
jgi:hypothetical protein